MESTLERVKRIAELPAVPKSVSVVASILRKVAQERGGDAARDIWVTVCNHLGKLEEADQEAVLALIERLTVGPATAPQGS